MTPDGRIDRADLRLIADMVPEGARVLDLGCGDGELLAWLRDDASVVPATAWRSTRTRSPHASPAAST
ncbi:MAG: methionine biosynthesis protein MetW [Gammaproteobacteria bacterium]|nr:methionine biosynthesis protein MetW [Gammaproteobacteria bacterium]